MSETNNEPPQPKQLDAICPASGKPVFDMGVYYWFPGYPRTYCNKEVKSRTMTVEDYLTIFKGEETIFKGFISSAGKDFNAGLAYNKELERIEFFFPPENPLDELCPISKKPIDSREKFFVFPAFPKVAFWKNMNGRQMDVQDYILVVENHPNPVEFHNFMSKEKKRPYSAPIRINTEEEQIELAFDDKEKKPKKSKKSGKNEVSSAANSDPLDGF